VSDSSRPIDEARRRLGQAANRLAELRRLGGAAPEEIETESEATTGLRAALEQSRRALEDRSRELESAKSRVRELERERAEWLARAVPPQPDAEERARRAEEETRRAKEAAAAENAGLSGRVSLLQAEIVRLEALRRKAEEAVQNAERSRHGVEETVRRELREAHSAVDRAAIEAGAREARAQAEAQAFQRRLDAALTRLEQVERERRVESDKARVERERLASSLHRAAAAHAALRRELLEVREGADARERELTARLQSSERALARDRADDARRLPSVEPAPPPVPVPEAPPAPAPAPARPSLAGGRSWARLVARLRPAVESAYAQLRGLSATVPLNEDERRALRRAAGELAGLSEAVVLLERYLDDGPGGAAGPVLPVLERALADWRPALEKRGCALTLSVPSALPDAVRDLEDLRLVFDQLLRNAYESLPAGAKLAVSAAPTPHGGVRVTFEDDGRGLPVEARVSAFEPLEQSRPGRLGLGLALVRRAVRRWGGEAVLETPLAGGVRVVLLFAPAATATNG
jgi:signal transduction histidine kinase